MLLKVRKHPEQEVGNVAKDGDRLEEIFVILDDLFGGGPRTGADYSEAPHFATPSFEHFFVIPIVEEGGKPTFG